MQLRAEVEQRSVHHVILYCMTAYRVPTGQGKLEKVREFEWSGKVRENAKVTGKSGKFGGKFYVFVQLL